MAPRIFSKAILITLALALCLFTLPVPALADAPALQEHVFKFYLDPALIPDMNFAMSVLPKYIADMNLILSKNTNRRLLFDPATGIILTSTKPQTDSGPNPLPTDGFEVWAYATHTDQSLSFGGFASMDLSGAGVVTRLNWTRIYDPDSLAASEVTDYTLQLDHLLHELAHVFGAGIGEYYNIASITDTTSIEPLLDIRLSNPNDSFWSDKPDFMFDPVLRFTYTPTRAEYLVTAQYSNLTAAVMNGSYRQSIPSFDRYTVQVLDESGAPIAGANVRVWNIRGYFPYQSELLFDNATDENGQILLPWGGKGSSHNASNFLRLIKVYKDGVPIVTPRYISIFDADSALLVYRESTFIVTMQALPEPSLASIPTRAETFIATGENEDGWVLESAQSTNKGGSLNTKASTFLLGDDASDKQYRAILSFDTSGLPDNAVITNVKLMVTKHALKGTDPFRTHGNLMVDIRTGWFGTSDLLQKSDFQAKPSAKGIGVFGTASINNRYTANLNNAAYPYINMTGMTQFRLGFSKDDNNDGGADFIKFFSGNAEATNRPQLIVKYTVP